MVGSHRGPLQDRGSSRAYLDGPPRWEETDMRSRHHTPYWKTFNMIFMVGGRVGAKLARLQQSVGPVCAHWAPFDPVRALFQQFGLRLAILGTDRPTYSLLQTNAGSFQPTLGSVWSSCRSLRACLGSARPNSGFDAQLWVGSTKCWAVVEQLWAQQPSPTAEPEFEVVSRPDQTGQAGSGPRR